MSRREIIQELLLLAAVVGTWLVVAVGPRWLAYRRARKARRRALERR